MDKTDFRTIYFPYCLQQQKDNKFVVLNRKYKPLGFFTSEFLNNEEFPVLVEFHGLTEKIVMELAVDGSTNKENIYLYNDECVPTNDKKSMEKYLKKLELLSKLKISK